jgi:hypothetical protein
MLNLKQVKASLESRTWAFPLQLKSCRLHFADGKVNINFWNTNLQRWQM